MALTFDGSSDHLSTATALFSAASDTTFTISLVAWCRPDNKHQGTIIGADNGSSYADQFSIYCVSGGKFRVRHESSYITGSAAFGNANSTWFHVAAVLEHSDRWLYLDGVEDASNGDNRAMDVENADTFYIGINRLSERFEGAIADAAAYSTSLTADEIAALAAGYSPLFIQPDKLVGYWPLGGISYPADYADVSQGNDLTATGSPSIVDHPPIIYPTSPAILTAAPPETADTLAAIQYYYR